MKNNKPILTTFHLGGFFFKRKKKKVIFNPFDSNKKHTIGWLIGRSLPISWAFVVGGIEFEEKWVDREEFKKLKFGLKEYPYTSVPTLNVDGTLIAQSNSILRYVGKMANLYSL